MLYCNGATPPVPVAVMLPFALPQDATVEVAERVGKAVVGTITLTELMQPKASLTYNV